MREIWNNNREEKNWGGRGGGGGREGENEKKKQMIFAITMSWVTKKRKIIAIAKPNKA